MLTEIEKTLRENGIPSVDEIKGSKPIPGSRYMHFSSSSTGRDLRTDPSARTDRHLAGSPFDDMTIDVSKPTPPFDGGSYPRTGGGASRA